MAEDLWGPPDHIVEADSSFGSGSEWQCHNCSCCGFGDVMEVDALNEKCCVQVLKMLITGADSEIEELGRDLVHLQSELAWIESEERRKLFCQNLMERIKCLNDSVRELRNMDKNDVEVQLLMHKQPVESLYDILKALLSTQLPTKEIQKQTQDTKDDIGSSFLLDADEQPAKMLNKEETRTNGDLDAAKQGDIRESDAVNEHSVTVKLLEFEKNKSDNSKRIKMAKAGTAEDRPSLSDGNEQSGSSEIMTLSTEGSIQHNSSSTVNIAVSSSLLNTVTKTADHSEKNKHPADCSIVKNQTEMGLTSFQSLSASHCSDSGFSTFERSSNIDIEQKLCDFLPSAARKKVSNKAKIASSSKAQKLGPQDGGEIATMAYSREGTSHEPSKLVLVGRLDGLISDFNCFNSLQKAKGQKVIKFSSSTVEGTGNETSILKYERQQKSEAQPNEESVFRPLKKRMTCAYSSGTGQVKDKTTQLGSSSNNRNEDMPGLSTTHLLASQCSSQINLQALKLDELRAIAKQRKVARFSKLPKKALLELLAK